MNKNFFLCLSMLFCQSAISQDTLVIYAQRVDSRIERLERIASERDAFIARTIEDLNSYEIGEDCTLPDFFLNSNFDLEFGAQYLLSSHGRVSLRKVIIDELTNYELMWCVVQSTDRRLKEKYKGRSKRFYMDYSRIPFEQFSTFELVDMRLDELENDKLLERD